MPRGLLNSEAEAHFKEHGDVVKFKEDGNPNASYEVIRGDVTRYAYGRLKDWQDAEDAVQEAYARILESGKEEGLNFGGLFKIVLDHTMMDMFRKDKVREHINEEDAVVPETNGQSLVELAEGEEVDPLRMLEMQERINFIMEHSNKLSPKSKGIIRMSLIFGYTRAEVATILKIKQHKVANVVAYFRKKLEEWEDDEN